MEEKEKQQEEETAQADEEERESETIDEEEGEESESGGNGEQAEQREQLQQQIGKLDDIIADYQAKKLADMKRDKLKQAKYSDEQADRYISFIDGETAKEIERSIRHLLQDIPPNKVKKYVDPSANNGRRQSAKVGKGEQLRQLGYSLADRFSGRR